MTYAEVKKLKHFLKIMKSACENNDTLMSVWKSDIEIVELAVKELEASAEI